MKLGALLLGSIRASEFVKVNRLVSVPGISCPTTDTDSTTDAVKDAFSLTKVKLAFFNSQWSLEVKGPLFFENWSNKGINSQLKVVIFMLFL